MSEGNSIDSTCAPPFVWPDASDWADALEGFRRSETFARLETFVADERRQHEVYPSAPDVFSAIRLTPLARVRVVILGQDPYHQPGQAHGLAFSVPAGTRIPPSLRNIFRELTDDLGLPNGTLSHSGDLTPWAKQGVLLLNRVLTVRRGQAGSHQRRGWEDLSENIIRTILAGDRPVAFILWGKAAQTLSSEIRPPHLAIKSPHPSPLSAHRGFFGSRPFSRVNEFLQQHGRDPIDWSAIG